MRSKYRATILLIIFIILSLAIKLILIFKYKNLLTLDSDDLNYVKSAVILVEKGNFIFFNYNEPTVFVTPLYPLFLAGVFKLFGSGLSGLQAARIIQAVFSCMTVAAVFLTAKRMFNTRIALAAAFLVSFYPPNITTSGYLLTETLFTMLLCLLILLSLMFAEKLYAGRFLLLGIIWALTTLCRPVVALYPVLLFIYIFIHYKPRLYGLIKAGAVMGLSFALVMSPWWVRNYLEYGEFIPLAASSGNPMLQGTYINYKQTPENITYYTIGKNTFETNKNEVETAKKRIRYGFRNDFWRYLLWYTAGKTIFLWVTAFYWKEFLGINVYVVLAMHYLILLGFAGLALLMRRGFSKYLLPTLVLAYFNFIHCIYMTFDRYAFPVMPLMSIFSAFLLVRTFDSVRLALRLRNRIAS